MTSDERGGPLDRTSDERGTQNGGRGGRVIVVGSVNSDLVVRARALPRPGETVPGEEFVVVGGGKGANAAVAAARLGATVALVACVGEDDFGAARLAELGHEGIELGGIRRSGAASSGVAIIAVDAAGENSIVVVPGTNALLTPDAAAPPVGPGDVVLTQLEIPPATVEAALRHARAAGAATILNAAPFLPVAGALLPLADVLIVNELEAADLLGSPRITPADAPAAVTALLRRGPGTVALTLGPHGAFVGQRGRDKEDEVRHFPAPAVTVVDTTAAGDAFCGALATGLAAGHTPFTASERAVIAGSLAVTRAGAQPSLPNRDEIRAFAAREAEGRGRSREA